MMNDELLDMKARRAVIRSEMDFLLRRKRITDQRLDELADIHENLSAEIAAFQMLNEYRIPNDESRIPEPQFLRLEIVETVN